MPMYPKKVVMITLSTMMSFRMVHGLAPIALRMPNSWVRSFTVMSMMFETPTMPESNVNSPTTHSAVRMISMPLFICMADVKRFHIQMAPSSSGAASWLAFSRC